MDEGWTRWVMKEYDLPVDTLHDGDVRMDDLSKYSAIILPHHYSNDVLLNGHEAGTMPPEYVGGLGREGAAALEQYVEDGGTDADVSASSAAEATGSERSLDERTRSTEE